MLIVFSFFAVSIIAEVISLGFWQANNSSEVGQIPGIFGFFSSIASAITTAIFVFLLPAACLIPLLIVIFLNTRKKLNDRHSEYVTLPNVGDATVIPSSESHLTSPLLTDKYDV